MKGFEPINATTAPPTSDESTGGATRTLERPATIGQVGPARARPPADSVWSVVGARPADYADLEQFLTSVVENPSPTDFKTSLEDPFYEPYDRLLVHQGANIVGHAHLTRRVMQFGPLQIPVAGLRSLTTAPEIRGHGCGRRLLVASERQMACHGALVGLLETNIPHFFRNTGWALCGQHGYSQAGTRSALCTMLDKGLRLHRRSRRQQLPIRCWRRMELPALMRLYNENLSGAYGPFQRTEAYWQWLIRRRSYDQLYVILDGPDLLELEENRTPIVGYAATRGERILELLTAPTHRAVAVRLLARACHDVIEQGANHVAFHGPPAHPLHELLQSAGGKRVLHGSDRGGVYMARLLQPLRLLRLLAPLLIERAQAADLLYPLELGLLVEGRTYRVQIGQQLAKVDGKRAAEHCLHMSVTDFTRMVLGQLD